MRSGRGCPVLGTTSSRCSARKGRSAMLLLSLGKHIQRGQKAAHAARTEGKKSIRNSPVNTKVREEQGEEVLQQRFPCSLLRRPRAGVSLQPAERTMQEQSSTLQPLGNTTAEEVGIPKRNYGIWGARAEAREKCEKEGAAERNWYGLTPPLFPSVLLGIGEGQRRVRSKAETGKKRAGGEML